MILLFFSVVIALTLIVLGMIIMNRAGKHVNIDRLKVFIAVAAGFMISAVFIELIPENLARYEAGPRVFFAWALLGMAIVVCFERYVVNRLRFVEKFFAPSEARLSTIETHDEHVHHDTGDHHHHHHDLGEATACKHSHQHGHVHEHTHLEMLGFGEVCSAIACFMVCSFFDGIALSSVQAVDAKLGIVLIIGVVLHLLPEGILSGAMALAGGATMDAAKKVLFFIGGSFVLGSLIPFIFHGLESRFLAMSSGILIFVTLVQLLPTALRLRLAPLWIGLGSCLFFASHALLESFGLSI